MTGHYAEAVTRIWHLRRLSSAFTIPIFFVTPPVIMTGSCILILVARVVVLSVADSWIPAIIFSLFSCFAIMEMTSDSAKYGYQEA